MVLKKNKIAIYQTLSPVLQQKNIVIQRLENNHYDWGKIEKILHLNKYDFQAKPNKIVIVLKYKFYKYRVKLKKF